MAHLSVRTATMSDGNSFASPLEFDFSGDIGTGEQILSYAVAMSGFVLNYETNSPYWAEKAGQLAVALTPNLFGTALDVCGNVVLTDYDGDAARDPGESVSDPGSVAQVTVLAVIGIPAPGRSPVAGTAFGLPSGQDSGNVPIGSNTDTVAFLAGFSLAGTSGSTGSIGGLSLTSSVSSPVADEVKLNGEASTPGFQTTGTVDVGVLAYGAALTGFQIVPVSVSWSSPDDESGMNGSFSATCTVPSGQSITQAALLLQDVSIVYEDTAEFQMIRAMPVGNLSINGDVVSGTFNLNMYNPDFGAREYIKSSSNATMSVIVQFS
jgi:hypothetical protein